MAKEIKMEKQELDLTTMSKEELVKIVKQQNETIQKMYLDLTNRQNLFKRLEFLFSVPGIEEHFTDEFKKNCAAEIMNLMILKNDSNSDQ